MDVKFSAYEKLYSLLVNKIWDDELTDTQQILYKEICIEMWECSKPGKDGENFFVKLFGKKLSRDHFWRKLYDGRHRRAKLVFVKDGLLKIIFLYLEVNPPKGITKKEMRDLRIFTSKLYEQFKSKYSGEINFEEEETQTEVLDFEGELSTDVEEKPDIEENVDIEEEGDKAYKVNIDFEGNADDHRNKKLYTNQSIITNDVGLKSSDNQDCIQITKLITDFFLTIAAGRMTDIIKHDMLTEVQNNVDFDLEDSVVRESNEFHAALFTFTKINVFQIEIEDGWADCLVYFEAQSTHSSELLNEIQISDIADISDFSDLVKQLIVKAEDLGIPKFGELPMKALFDVEMFYHLYNGKSAEIAQINNLFPKKSKREINKLYKVACEFEDGRWKVFDFHVLNYYS